MSFRDNIIRILKEYPKATSEAFKEHQIANFIRHEFPESLKEYFEAPERYIWQGSAGQGNWARAPWLAVFDVLITDTVQSGYYPVYLFREDLTGLYLSLNQGVTEIREKYRSQAKEALKTKAADFRAQIGSLPNEFPLLEIDLRPDSPSNLSAYYEVGNICAKFYDSKNIPLDEEFISDFNKILHIYELLSYNETIPVGTGSKEEDESPNLLFEDLRKLRQHKRIERNSRLVKEAKKIHGYDCKLCGFNFGKEYGEIGKGFIEAHHLTPISELKGSKILLNPKKDFTVLCSNCHRMIHRCEKPHDLEAFREKYF